MCDRTFVRVACASDGKSRVAPPTQPAGGFVVAIALGGVERAVRGLRFQWGLNLFCSLTIRLDDLDSP